MALKVFIETKQSNNVYPVGQDSAFGGSSSGCGESDVLWPNPELWSTLQTLWAPSNKGEQLRLLVNIQKMPSLGSTTYWWGTPVRGKHSI